MPDQDQLLSFGIAICLVIGALAGLIQLIRLDRKSGLGVDPNARPSPNELEGFQRILDCQGLPGLAFAAVVSLVVAVLAYLALPSFGASPGESGELPLMLGLFSGFLTYAARLSFSRCPRCRRRLIGWWALLGVPAFITSMGRCTLARCPHCDTPFEWSAADGASRYK